jgi:hypothetical protein
LDLQVTKARSPQEAASLKNFYFGFVTQAAGIDPVQKANEFHGGPPLAQRRKELLLERLEKIKALSEQLKRYPQINILAQWFIKGEFRINNLFHMMGQTNEALASEIMGFVPSSNWKKWKSPADYLKSIRMERETFDKLLNDLKQANIAAFVRGESGGARFIFVGMADNEVGLLFLGGKDSKPKAGDMLPDGKKFVGLEEIEPGIYFYTTS